MPHVDRGDFAIPKSVSTIGDGAFTNCMLLTSVMVPTSVKKVGGTGICRLPEPDGCVLRGHGKAVECDLGAGRQ